MPDKPRKDKMNPEEIEIHHIWSRCVGRAYLLGVDPLTKVDYSHRRVWLESAYEYFASVFAVEVGTYHIMSNHTHDVSRSRPDIAAEWSDEEVVWRWKRAWPRYKNGEWIRIPTDEEIEAVFEEQRHDENRIPKIRRNLANISWFQARLKQSIARLANIESNKRGHHWEQRFGNRKLEDENDVIAGFLYNDMQQVRAGIVDSVEASDHSAIQRQIKAHARRAFSDFNYRDPEEGQEDDARELEQLEALFADCFLSPIRADGPLLTVPESTVPPNELVLPQGYLFEQEATSQAEPELESPEVPAAVSESPDLEPQQDVCQTDQESTVRESDPSEPDLQANDEPEAEAQSAQQAAAFRTGPRRRGRPRRTRRYRIHQRLKQQQRRRASRCSILGIPWEQYHDILKELERKVIAERARSQPVPTESPPGAVPDSCSPTTWWRSVREFSAWLQVAAVELPQHLASYLLPRPRSDPPVAE